MLPVNPIQNSTIQTSRESYDCGPKPQTQHYKPNPTNTPTCEQELAVPPCVDCHQVPLRHCPMQSCALCYRQSAPAFPNSAPRSPVDLLPVTGLLWLSEAQRTNLTHVPLVYWEMSVQYRHLFMPVKKNVALISSRFKQTKLQGMLAKTFCNKLCVGWHV